MFKTFVIGIILGLGGTGAMVHYVPAVNQHREASLISFEVNKGNSELFQINLPDDRILAGSPGRQPPVPAALEWPNDRIFTGSQAEMFKIRDRNDEVIGIASRMASDIERSGALVQWMLHFPARGTMVVTFDPAAPDGRVRNGVLRGGTGDFAELSGTFTEQFVDEVQDPEAEITGRIQLVSRLIGAPQEEE